MPYKSYRKYPDCNRMALWFITVSAANESEKACVVSLPGLLAGTPWAAVQLSCTVSHGATYCLIRVCSLPYFVKLILIVVPEVPTPVAW